MATQYPSISEQHIEFIEKQKMFFVGTAGAEGRVNISPKGMDSLRVLNPKKVIWLNLTGSGNETAAHIYENGRITLMFCAFDGPPLILRLYGQAKVFHPRDAGWDEYFNHFSYTSGARQIIEVNVEMAMKSCGFGVPLYEFQAERELLTQFVEKKGEQGIKDYWRDKNQVSIDGKPTGIFEVE